MELDDIDVSAFLKLTENSVLLSANLRDQLARSITTFISKIEIISAGSTPRRLAVLMMQLIDRYGINKEKNRAQLPFSLTLAQMSEIVDARIETVARVLGSWKRAGWITSDSSGLDFLRLDKVGELRPYFT